MIEIFGNFEISKYDKLPQLNIAKTNRLSQTQITYFFNTIFRWYNSKLQSSIYGIMHKKCFSWYDTQGCYHITISIYSNINLSYIEDCNLALGHLNIVMQKGNWC